MATILHVDMDAFYAAVEQLDHPEYRGKPLIIGGTKDSVRGVVSTCSYEARKYGVRSAMPIKRAVALCPHGIFIPGRMHRYQEVSRQIHAVFQDFSPLVESISIDEAFLDMTGCEHFYPSLEAMGRAVKDRIKNETGLTCSVGIGPNKFLAKLASEWQKPDGLTIIYPDQVDAFLLNLPVGKIWGVGVKSKEALKKLGINTVRDLREKSLDWLQQNLGPSFGTHLYNLCRGIDSREVTPYSEAKSISQEITFDHDYEDEEFLRSQLAAMAEKVGYRLRREKLYARTVTIKVRYGDFSTITRSQTLDYAVCDDDSLFNIGWKLLQTVKKAPVRLLGIGAHNLVHNQQMSLFDNTVETNKLAEVMDQINQKYGKAITKGRTLKPKK
ncbi:MAG TPA: DNA polymerase IV [Limnochordia bacterium]|jgi:DNA polymerase-4|nr:DNA polymerase IV [Bacillota bacterium]HXK97791.1 DNA polymerase IV [Limnochordia bacterium]